LPSPARGGVTDGDTITVMHQGKGEKIRLYGIDCPEKRQAFGQKEKQYTSDMVYGKVVEVEAVEIDRDGRTVELLLTGFSEVEPE
jgi:micrococcal nuclease